MLLKTFKNRNITSGLIRRVFSLIINEPHKCLHNVPPPRLWCRTELVAGACAAKLLTCVINENFIWKVFVHLMRLLALEPLRYKREFRNSSSPGLPPSLPTFNLEIICSSFHFCVELNFSTKVMEVIIDTKMYANYEKWRDNCRK